MTLLTALSVLPALALAASSGSTHQIGVLLVPLDNKAEAASVRLGSYLEEGLDSYSQVTVKKSEELFGLPPDEEADAALKRAEQSYKEGRDAFDARSWEDAEKKLRAASKDFQKGAAAMKGCGHLCDTLAMYAATLHVRGDPEEARLVLIDLQALHPTYELDRKRFAHDFMVLRTQVATARSASLRGNIRVRTKPAGARVFVDGDFQGYAPLTLQTLPIGKHIVRIERPGFKVFGVVHDVTPEDSDLVADLKATPAFRGFDAQMDKLASEVGRDRGGATMAVLGRQLGLDQALAGTLKDKDEGTTELQVGLYDLKSGKRLASKKATFQGDEFGQIKSEVNRLVNSLMSAGDPGAEKATKARDPLEGRSGYEDWSAEDKGGRTREKEKKKKKGDPLDGVSGTEDW